jgi:hypothetical protein
VEIESNKDSEQALLPSENRDDIIKVRAIISCPTCEYVKKFRNQFPRNELELMVVTLKIFDWLCCNKCGELLNLTLEFNI